MTVTGVLAMADGLMTSINKRPFSPNTRQIPRSAAAGSIVAARWAGIQAATDLAEQGFPVTLVEKTAALGGRLASPNLKTLNIS